MPLGSSDFGGVIAAPGVLLDRSWKVGDKVQAAMERGEAPSNEIVEVSILRLKNARYRRGRPLPEWVQELDVPPLSAFEMSAEHIPVVVADSPGSSMRTNPIALDDEELFLACHALAA